eukprot:10702535-Heterocapsa_arctica.AAC.1
MPGTADTPCHTCSTSRTTRANPTSREKSRVNENSVSSHEGAGETERPKGPSRDGSYAARARPWR